MLSQESGWVGRWSPGIGDASVAGWVTVVAYFFAVFLCARAYLRRRSDERYQGEKRVWLALACALLGLGINKQLDLQTALTEAGRTLAMQQGWYAERRVVQGMFVLAVIVAGVVVGAWLFRQARRSSKPLRKGLLGAVTLGAFVVVRAASFHHVDLLLGQTWAGLRLNVLLEIGGIVWVAWGAASVPSTQKQSAAV